MLDRLFYRSSWFNLPNQRPLDECFWQHRRQKRPLVGYPAHPLGEDEYSCDWKIDETKLWLLSAYCDEDGSDLLSRILPGSLAPVFCSWHSGVIDANGEMKRRKRKETGEYLNEIPIVRFHVEDGYVFKTEHFNLPPQPGWNEDEPSLRARSDWKKLPE